MNWMILPYRRYADFDGRSRRQEYWMFTLLNIVIYTIFITIFLLNVGLSIGSGGALAPLALLTLVIGGVWVLGNFIPTLAVIVRRFHDQNLSGWWSLLAFVPYVGSLVLIVFMCLPGTAGPNRFGEDPLTLGPDAVFAPPRAVAGDRAPFAAPPPRPISYDYDTGSDSRPEGDARDTRPAPGIVHPARGLRLHGMTPSGHAVRFALDPGDPVLREGNFVIGRGSACNVVIADDSVSRSHAMCIVRADQYLIRDLQSRNQTRVNGVPLVPDRPRALHPGDVLHLGRIELVVAAA